MRRYLAILLLVILVITPLTLGAETDIEDETMDDSDGTMTSGDNENVRSEYEERLREQDDLRAEYRDRLGDGGDAVRAEIQERVRDSEIETRLRVVSSNDYEQHRDGYHNARNRYEASAESYKERMEAFREAKQEWQSCEADCEELRTQMLRLARNSLGQAINAVIAHLDRWENRLGMSEDLTEEEIAVITADIDAYRVKARELAAEAEAATTGTDVAIVAHKLHDLVDEAKHRTERYRLRTEGQADAQHVLRAERWQERLQCTVNAGADIDTSSYDAAVVQAREAFNEAKRLHELEDFAGAREQLLAAENTLRTAAQEWERVREELREQGLEIADCAVEDNSNEVFDDDDLEDELEDDDLEEAEEEMQQAQDEIDRARDEVDAAAADGEETGASEELLSRAEEALLAARNAFILGDYEAAEEGAEHAREYAQKARMKYLGKPLSELSEDDADDDSYESDSDDEVDDLSCSVVDDCADVVCDDDKVVVCDEGECECESVDYLDDSVDDSNDELFICETVDDCDLDCGDLVVVCDEGECECEDADDVEEVTS